MGRFLFLLFSLPVVMCPHYSIVKCFNGATLLECYSDGARIELTQNDLVEFNSLFSQALEGAREMPAYCVSLHEESVKALEEGIWARFVFSNLQVHNDMTFNDLFVKIERDTQGVNIIRGNFGFLEGRCFYLDLENNFNELYDFLSGLNQVKLEKNDWNEDILQRETFDGDVLELLKE